MNLKPLGANQTELSIGTLDVLFSYSTPVAVWDTVTDKTYVTDKFWSVTTSKHINKWLSGMLAKEMPQSYFDNLLAEVK